MTLKQEMGVDRFQHAATIAAHNQLWQSYEDANNQAFIDAGLQKYCAVNAGGKIIARNADKSKLALNADTTLRHEDFLMIQDKIVQVRELSLTSMDAVKAAGLTFPVSIEEQIVGYETTNQFRPAKQEMNPNHTDNNDTVFDQAYTPNPITHSGFNVPWRQQGFQYKRSLGLSESIRVVAERLEETLVNGNSGISVNFSGSNHTIYGYTTHPDRGTGTISDWTNAANNDVIVTELITQIGLMWSTQGGVANNSVDLEVSNTIWTNFQKDYDSGYPSKPIMDRIKDIAQIREVRPSKKLASTHAVLVEMDERTIQIASASDIIAVPHTMVTPFAPQAMTIYAAQVPIIKADRDGNTGIRHLTP